MAEITAQPVTWFHQFVNAFLGLQTTLEGGWRKIAIVILAKIFLNLIISGLLGLFLSWLLTKWKNHENRRSHRSMIAQSLVLAIQKPFFIGFIVAALIWTIRPLHIITPQWLIWIYLHEIQLLWLLGVLSWIGLRFTNQIERQWINREANSVEIATARAITYFIRVAIFLGVFVAALSILKIDLTGLLTVGGVSGLVVGLSGRNTIANFLGALSIHFERPFTIGDYIRSSEHKIEGTVEHIGWSLTKIRNSDEIPTLIPNSTFTSIVIENLTRRRHQIINPIIGIRYQDISVLPDVVRDIEKLLREHNDIDNNKPIYARLSKFSASSLDCEIKCYTKVIQTGPFQAILQDILIRIAHVIEAHGAAIAFPTQELYLHQS